MTSAWVVAARIPITLEGHCAPAVLPSCLEASLQPVFGCDVDHRVPTSVKIGRECRSNL